MKNRTEHFRGCSNSESMDRTLISLKNGAITADTLYDDYIDELINTLHLSGNVRNNCVGTIFMSKNSGELMMKLKLVDISKLKYAIRQTIYAVLYSCGHNPKFCICKVEADFNGGFSSIAIRTPSCEGVEKCIFRLSVCIGVADEEKYYVKGNGEKLRIMFKEIDDRGESDTGNNNWVTELYKNIAEMIKSTQLDRDKNIRIVVKTSKGTTDVIKVNDYTQSGFANSIREIIIRLAGDSNLDKAIYKTRNQAVIVEVNNIALNIFLSSGIEGFTMFTRGKGKDIEIVTHYIDDETRKKMRIPIV